MNNPVVTRHGTLKQENLLIDRYRNHVAPYGTDLFLPPPSGDEESRVISLISIRKKEKRRKEKETRIRHSAQRDKNLGQ